MSALSLERLWRCGPLVEGVAETDGCYITRCIA